MHTMANRRSVRLDWGRAFCTLLAVASVLGLAACSSDPGGTGCGAGTAADGDLCADARSDATEAGGNDVEPTDDSADGASQTDGVTAPGTRPGSDTDDSTDSCVQRTCAAARAECGRIVDGCGGEIDCGECSDGDGPCRQNRCVAGEDDEGCPRVCECRNGYCRCREKC